MFIKHNKENQDEKAIKGPKFKIAPNQDRKIMNYILELLDQDKAQEYQFFKK